VHTGRDGESPARALSLSHPDGRALSTLVSDADPSTSRLSLSPTCAQPRELFALLTSLLRASVREACVAVPMECVKGCTWANLSDERIVKCSQFCSGGHSAGNLRGAAGALPARPGQDCVVAAAAFFSAPPRAASDCRSHPARRGSAATPCGLLHHDVAGGPTLAPHPRRSAASPSYLPPPYDPAQLSSRSSRSC